MSEFSDAWAQCMQGDGLPVPDLDTAREALEFLDKLHSAWENAGAGEELTIGALIAAGTLTGVDEATLAALGGVAEVAAALYIGRSIHCIGSVALDDLRELLARDELPGFVVAQLESQGVDIAKGAPA